MRRKGRVRVTTRGGPRGDGRHVDADVHAARQAGVAALRSALAGLTDGATGTARTRRTHRPDCRVTRAAMHDYVKGHLAPGRQRRVEVHLDRCDPCTRAFTDVREVSWALRGLGRRLAAGGHRGGRHRRAARRART
jgi:hypothetical protein